jgi:excisionase family DNA binding protein
MQKYYTLEEAARVLRATPDQLREMAKKNQVRAFQDRGNLRFRSTEIDELARERGLGSEPDLPLGEAARSDVVPLGEEPRKGSSRKKGPRTPSSPPPKASSDSDVRLVDDSGDLSFSIHEEETPEEQPPESSVRLVGMDDSGDSDVKLEQKGEKGRPKSASDSDIRLDEKVARQRDAEGSDDALVTEEIDLDAEAEALSGSAAGQGPPSPESSVLPTSSPFELSESDLGPESGEEAGQGNGINLGEPSDLGISLEQGGSEQLEFEEGLAPVESEESGEIEDTDSSSDFELSVDDDSVQLKDDSSSEFELSLDEESMQLQDDSSSEFELSLDPDSPVASDESSSEFELSLDSEEVDSSSDFELEPVAGEDSDSEFELTLDEEGGLGVEEERDIFETDLAIPSGESGSEAVALEDVDADLEDSDFDLDIMEGEEEPVVDVGEDADAGAATVAQRRRPLREEEEDLDLEVAPAAEEEEEEVAAPVAAAPATWGPLPAIFLIPAVIVLFLVSLMSFEMVNGMWGYKKSTPVGKLIVHKLAKQFDDSLPD